MIHSLKPTEGRKRLIEIDILRGIALIGVLLTNVYMFNAPSDNMVVEYYPLSFTDHIIYFFLAIFIQGKFYTLFSLLFGFGFALQISRIKKKSIFFRRLIVLLIIGIGHSLLIWNGDILKIYALMGMLLLIFANWKVVNKFIFGGVLIGIFYIILCLSSIFANYIDENIKNEGEIKIQIEIEQAVFSEVEDVYRVGSYNEVTHQRLKEFVSAESFSLIFLGILYVLPLFLLGSIFGKIYLEASPEKIKTILTKSLIYSSIASIILFIPYYYFVINGFAENHSLKGMYNNSIGMMLNLPLSIVYASSILLILNKYKHKLIFRSMSYIGRTALTNYLLQSIIISTLAWGYGFGLMEKLNISQLFIFGALFFVFQILMSRLWLKYFKFGPFEWVWRCFTYGRVLAIKK